MLRASSFDQIEGLAHGFLDREESSRAGDPVRPVVPGISLPGPRAVISMEQVHRARVATVGPAATDTIRGVDGLVTRMPNKALVVRTADCIPALFVMPAARAVAAAHAGWRGLLHGVLRETVRRLERDAAASPDEVLCALGPTVGPCCYEFSRELFSSLLERVGPECHDTWSEREGRGHLDLRKLAVVELLRAGLRRQNIALVGGCTCCWPERFHSYRRDGGQAGRQLSFIFWQSG